MALVINTNLSSLRAQRNLDRTQESLSTSLQRISSGLRINSAKDDASGFAISQRFSSQIGKIGEAVANANAGIVFVKSAEGALGQIGDKLKEIQAFAVSAVRGSSSATDRSGLQANVRKALDSIGQLSEIVEFNDKKILTGKIVNAEFQVGLRAEQVIRVTVPLITPANIGNYSIKTDNAGEGKSVIGGPNLGTEAGEAPTNGVKGQTITIRGASSNAAGSQIGVDEGETAKSIVEKINELEARTGVTATAASYATLEDIYDVFVAGEQKISFNLYGINAKGVDAAGISTAVSISAKITSGSEDGLRGLVDAINAQTSKTGIRANFFSELVDDVQVGKIALQNGGVDIGIEKFRNDPPGAPVAGSLNATTITVGGFAGTTKVVLNEDGLDDSVTIGGVVTLNSGKAFTATSDADELSSLFLTGVNEVPQTADFTAVSDLDLTTEEGAKRALVTAASALDFISLLQGDLGSIQKGFEATISNLDSIKENTQTARSQILDADFAQETANLTRAQVLQQAGIAILAQANTTPQAVLALLRT